jgi:hypothetical protein
LCRGVGRLRGAVGSSRLLCASLCRGCQAGAGGALSGTETSGARPVAVIAPVFFLEGCVLVGGLALWIWGSYA